MAQIPPTSISGWTVIPDLNVLRQEYKRDMGQERGNQAANALPADGWIVVFDLRDVGLSDGLICERRRPDGTVRSICWERRHIHAAFDLPREA